MTTDRNPAALRARALTIRFARPDTSDLVLVKDLDLVVTGGDLVTVWGRSGSGKTSLLRTLTGQSMPSGGSVYWWGTALATMTDNQRRDLRRTRIGLLDQGAAMVPELTVLENVLLPVLPDGRRQVRAARSRALELLEVLGLVSRLDALPATISGGERQRAALARALLCRPEVLVVDEPTASLDRVWADGVIQHLVDHAHGGGAVLAASHDPHLRAAATTVLEIER